jgi:hypothetical protein
MGKTWEIMGKTMINGYKWRCYWEIEGLLVLRWARVC